MYEERIELQKWKNAAWGEIEGGVEDLFDGLRNTLNDYLNGNITKGTTDAGDYNRWKMLLSSVKAYESGFPEVDGFSIKGTTNAIVNELGKPILLNEWLNKEDPQRILTSLEDANAEGLSSLKQIFDSAYKGLIGAMENYLQRLDVLVHPSVEVEESKEVGFETVDKKLYNHWRELRNHQSILYEITAVSSNRANRSVKDSKLEDFLLQLDQIYLGFGQTILNLDGVINHGWSGVSADYSSFKESLPEFIDPANIEIEVLQKLEEGR